MDETDDATPVVSGDETDLNQLLGLFDAPAPRFGFYRVKEDLGWHHCNVGPEDDQQRAWRLDSRSCNTPPNTNCRFERDAGKAAVAQGLVHLYWTSRSRRQLAGLWPKACLNSLLRCD